MASFTVTGSDTAAKTLIEGNNGTDDTGTVTAAGNLNIASGVGVALDLSKAPAGNGVVITNAGMIQTQNGRTIDTGSTAIFAGSQSTSGAKLTIKNSGTITNNVGSSGNNDVIRINNDLIYGTFLLYNAGTVSATGLTNDSIGVRLGKVYSASNVQIYNGMDANGTINTSAKITTLGADAIRPGGANPTNSLTSFGSSTVTNYGTIDAKASTAIATLSKVNGVDIGAGQASTVNNYGTIIGDESGLGSDNSAGGANIAPTYFVTNYAGATITGRNGPAIAIGSSTSASAGSTTSTVTNFGTITGQATGTGRGGTNSAITNANGTGIFSAYDITIVNGGTSNATAVIQGSGIKGTAAPGAQQGSSTTYYAINATSGSVTNYGTIRETTATGAGAAINFSGSAASTVTNYGSIVGANGAAIALGTGNDTVNLYSGGTITGTIDGGAGTGDILTLNAGTGTTTGTFNSITNIEILKVNSGSWTLGDAETYSGGVTIAAGANLTIGDAGSTGAAIVDNGSLTYAKSGNFTKGEAISGTGKLVQAGAGTLTLTNGASTYSGGTTILTGALDVTAAGAAGTGAITFATGAQTLDIEQTALAGDGSFGNTLTGLGAEDTIDLRSIGVATSATFDSSTNKLTVSGGNETVTLQLDGSGAPASGYAYGVSSDGAGGTNVAIDQIATVTNVTASPSSGYAKAGDTISFTLTTSKAVNVSNPPPVLNLSNGGTAVYDATTSTATSLVFKSTVANGQDSSGITITSVVNAADAQDAKHVPLDFSGATSHAAVGPTIDTMAPMVAITSTAGLTNQATQTISGTVDAATNGSPDNGSVVSIYETVNGSSTLLGTATVSNGTWSSSVNLSGNGSHTIFAQDTDAAGNTGTSGAVTYDLETTAPPVAIKSAGGLTNQPTQTILGHVDVGADPEAVGTTVTVTDTGSNTVLGTGTVSSSGDFSVGVTLTGQGQHTLQASDTDNAGNVGFATVTYNVDTVAPAAPSATLANDTGTSQTDRITSDPTINYTPSAGGDTLLYSVNGSSYATTAPSFATDGSQDGTYTISVEEQDPAGNISSASNLTFSLDTTAPTTAPTISLTNDTGASATDNYTSDPSFAATAGTGGDTVFYAADGSTTYSITAPVFKTDGTQDGTHTISVVEKDVAGNQGPASSLVFNLDTQSPAPPTVALVNDTGTSSGDNVTNDATISYTPSSNGDTLLYKADGATTYSTTAPTFTTDGSHTVSVEEVDKAGNVSSASKLTFTLDTTPPDIDFTSMGGTVNNAAQIVNGFAGADNVGTTVRIYEDGGTTAVGTALVNGDGYFSASVNLGASGPHTLSATVTDKAGNVGTTDETLAYTVDPTQPTFTPGNLVISISGNGDGSGDYGDNEASPLVLRQITTDGTYVSQIVLPQTTTVVNGVTESVVSAEYGSSSEGSLQLSADGHSLVIAGYGVNAATYNAGGVAVYGNAALAQSTSIQGGQYTAVPRVIADVNANGTIDTSTILYNVYNGNNPRSVATIDGSSFYISGQGTKGDTTQGVFLVQDGSGTATRIDRSTDTRTAVIYNGQLYISRDSKQNSAQPGQGSGGSSNISVYGPNLPTSTTQGTILQAINQSVVVTPGNANTVNSGAVGSSVNLDPENFFFANSTTLYVADGGIPKAGGVGDGGLQKWVYNGTQWTLQYTLSNGLNIVAPGAAEGTTGLIGLTGRVDGNTVELYATNQTVGDTDQKYVFGITDTLGATTNSGQSFTTLVTADPDTNIRGISFAPTPITPTLVLADDTGASASDNVTNDATLTYTKAVAGDTLLYSVNGGAYASMAPTFGSDGTYTVSVEEQDKGGAIGPASSLTFTLDTNAPGQPSSPTLTAASDTGSSSTDGVTSNATPTLTGTAEAGATVKLYDGTQFVGTAVADANGTYTIASSKLVNGPHSLTVTAIDAAGNVSMPSSASSVTIDTVAPLRSAAPTLAVGSDTGVSTSDNITNVAAPTLTGTAEAGTTVTLYDGGMAVGQAVAGSDGKYSVTSSTLSDGTHALTVTSTDTAGNVSPVSPLRNVTIDTSAPAAPATPTLTAATDTGASSTDGITSDATPTVTGTAEAGSTVTLYEGTTVLGTAVAASSGTYTVTSSSLGDGAHKLTVTATDKAGNVSAVSAGLGITIDTVAPSQPAAPTLTAASDTGASSMDGITSNTTPTVAGTADAGSTVKLYDGTRLLGSAVAASNGSYAITSARLADGAHSLTVTSTDTAGNVSTASAALNVTIDTMAPGQPAAPMLTAASDSGSSPTDGITNISAPTLTGTAEAGSTVKLYDGTRYLGSATAGNDGSYAITTSNLGNGSHSFTATATDAAGNVSTPSAASAVTIDTVAPLRSAAPTLAPGSDTGASQADNLTNITTPTFTGTAEAGSTVTLYDSGNAVGTAVAGSNGTYNVTSSTLMDGVHSLTVTATDAAGNIGPMSPVRTVTIDTAAPGRPAAPTLAAGSDTGSSSTDGITSNALPRVTGTAEAGSTVSLYDGSAILGTAVAAANGTYTVTVSSALADGTHALLVTATDRAGNISSASQARMITVDTSAPSQPAAPTLAAASDTGSSSSDGITSDSTPTVTGTAEAGATVRLYDGSRLLGTAVAAQSGAFSITSMALANGVHGLTVTATDIAGNVSAASAALNVTIDTLAPSRPAAPSLTAASDTGSSATDGITSNATPTLTGTAEAGTIVKLYEGSRYLGTATAGSNGVYSITSTAMLPNGSHSFNVTSTDAAGNVSAASATSTVTIDTVAPTRMAAPTLAAGSDTGSSTTDGITSDATPTLTGKTEAGATVTLYDGGAVAGTATAKSDGTYSVTSSVLSDGAHALTVTAKDTAGNVSAPSAARNVTIDTSAPGVAINGSGGTAPSSTQTISGTGEAGTSITLTDNGKAIGTKVTVGSDGTWSERIGLSAGANRIVASDTDKAGNVGTSQAVVYTFGASSAAQMSSMHSMIQAMSTMTSSSSASMTPTGAAAAHEAHPLAAAHA